MTLAFSREVILVNGLPTMGTVTVQVHASDPDSRLWQIDLEVTEFEPETGAGLFWSDVQAPCEAWLATNRVRVEKKALR